MDFAFALPAGLATVNMTDIALPIVFLTLPGIALTHGLKSFRDPDGPPGGKLAGVVQQPLIKLASFVSLLAMLAAGLGLVPLAHALYDVVSGTSKWAPALIGVTVLALGLVKWVVVSRDLADGKVDRPFLWLAAAPLVALVIWAVPTAYGQITDQAGHTFQEMIFGKHPDEHSRQGRHGESDTPPKHHDGKEAPRDKTTTDH